MTRCKLCVYPNRFAQWHYLNEKKGILHVMGYAPAGNRRKALWMSSCGLVWR